MPFLVWHASAYLYNMQILHILQDVLHDVLGDMLVLVVYAYSGSATPPCLFALVDERVSRSCHECCECMY